MTLSVFEKSIHDARPLELYEFSHGLQIFTYTSGDEAVSFQSRTYTPTALTRSAIGSSTEVSKMKLEIEVARDNEVAKLFIRSHPGPVKLTIYRLHRGDLDVVPQWIGRVVNVEFSGLTAKITCEPIYTSIERAGLRGMFQRLCRHALYDSGCTLNASAFRDVAMITSVVGSTITVVPMNRPSGWYTGGYIEVGDVEKKMIRDHSNDVLTLTGVTASLKAGVTINLFAGCAHDRNTCLNKFNNFDNYGGFEFIPNDLGPFKGDPIE
nr:phage BR0599 family protein [Nitrosomonas nitrosa]